MLLLRKRRGSLVLTVAAERRVRPEGVLTTGEDEDEDEGVGDMEGDMERVVWDVVSETESGSCGS